MKFILNNILNNKKTLAGLTVLFLLLSAPLSAQETNSQEFREYNGKIVNERNKQTLEFATIAVDGTNISTISNKDGKFRIKVPVKYVSGSITITYLGFKNQSVKLSEFGDKELLIKMIEVTETLPEVSLISSDPNLVIRKMLANRSKNYLNEHAIMKAFYRESIKKRRTYASLSEAVVDIYKKPYMSSSVDYAKLIKARKSTDYRKIDTLVIKLQGGPYNTLNIDLMRNDKMMFNEDVFKNYTFSFDKFISVDNRGTYVLDFKQSNGVYDPMFYGKLYIDAESYALSKAIFSLKLDNKLQASKYFVKKKPSKANVTPTMANYRIDYKYKEGRWHYNYGRIELSFKIDWKKRIFNSVYNIDIEMAVTDWEKSDDKTLFRGKEKMRSNVILTDQARGFSNPEFWGENNVIEPDKSIENAIKKIKRHLK